MRNGIRKSWLGKRAAVLVLVMSFVLALTGCIQYEAKATVNPDGTIDFGLLYATIDMSSLYSDDQSSGGSGSGTDYTQSLIDTMDGLRNAGWDVKEYKQSVNGQDYVGFAMTKRGIEIDKLQDELSGLQEYGLGFDGFTITKNGDHYVLDWDMTSNNSDLQSQGVDSSMLTQYGGFMKFTLELTNGAIDQNATEVSSDGNTLTWDLMGLPSVHAEFTIDKAALIDDDDDDEDDDDDDYDDDDDDDDDDDEDDDDSGKKGSKKSSKKDSKKSKKSKSDDGLPAWGLVAIIGGSVLVVGGIVVLIIVLVKKGKKNGQDM